MSIKFSENSLYYKKLAKSMGKYNAKAWDIFEAWYSEDYIETISYTPRSNSHRTLSKSTRIINCTKRFNDMCENFNKLIQEKELKEYTELIIDNVYNSCKKGGLVSNILSLILENKDKIKKIEIDELNLMLDTSNNFIGDEIEFYLKREFEKLSP